MGRYDIPSTPCDEVSCAPVARRLCETHGVQCLAYRDYMKAKNEEGKYRSETIGVFKDTVCENRCHYPELNKDTCVIRCSRMRGH